MLNLIYKAGTVDPFALGGLLRDHLEDLLFQKTIQLFLPGFCKVHVTPIQDARVGLIAIGYGGQ